MSKRILIIGAGFAGMWSALSAARLLTLAGKADGEIEVALIAPQARLHVRPRLYEIDPASMQTPLQAIFDAVGVRFIQGKVKEIRAAAQDVIATDAEGHEFIVSYDRLVLATGSTLFRPDIPGLKEHSFNVDQIEAAVALETHLISLKQQPESAAHSTIVVAGGGFTGIETAAEMPARLRAILGDRPVRVIIVERAAAIGPELGAGPRPIIEQALRELGVETKLNASVTAIDAEGLTLSTGERIASRTVIWTAGARANPLTEQITAQQIDAQRDPFGRLHVTRDLKVKGAANIFATGDVAFAATDDLGNHAAMSCQHAMNLGRSAGHNVAADLMGRPTIPYAQPHYVTCLDLGPWGAVYTEGWDRQVKLTGAEAKKLKHQINSEWIYPPRADRDEILAAADPARIVVA